MKILVGLGNPGEEYRHTRHNIGFMVMDAFAKSVAVRFRKSSPRCLTAHGKIGDGPASEALILAKPQTFMNRSGLAVRELLREAGADPSSLIIVYDDLDLPLGKFRIRTQGGPGGHRGVESIIASLQTQRFYRLRMGIGRPPAHRAADAYVLSPFLSEEQPIVQEMTERAVEALRCWVQAGPETAMNRFNQQ